MPTTADPCRITIPPCPLQDHDRVIQLVNEQLSQEASGKPDRQTRLQQLVLLAQSILKQQRYKPNVDNQAHERGRQLQTMQQLLAVSHTLSAFGAGDLDRCEKHLKVGRGARRGTARHLFTLAGIARKGSVADTCSFSSPLFPVPITGARQFLCASAQGGGRARVSGGV